MQKAKWYQQKENVCVCECCPHKCTLSPQQVGLCGTYIHTNNQLWNQRFYNFSSICMDPIEKKPLYHFYPGKNILSLGGYGCNLTCFYCQNHSISQNRSLGEPLSSQLIVQEAFKYNAIGVALTYNEPLINMETALDLFSVCHENGLQTVLVTNGYALEKPLQELAPLVDAVNLDIKFSNHADYQKYTGGMLDPIMRALQIFHTHCFTEVTYLVIPGLNDSVSAIDELCSLISSIDASIPVHFSAYFPHWKSTIPETPPAFIQKICHQASKTLSFVYGGNISPHYDPTLFNTYCPHCHSLWIERIQNTIRVHSITQNKCSICGSDVVHFKGLES